MNVRLPRITFAFTSIPAEMGVLKSLICFQTLSILILSFPQGGPIGACQISASDNSAFNLGYVQAMPEAATDGALSLRYVNGGHLPRQVPPQHSHQLWMLRYSSKYVIHIHVWITLYDIGVMILVMTWTKVVRGSVIFSFIWVKIARSCWETKIPSEDNRWFIIEDIQVFKHFFFLMWSIFLKQQETPVQYSWR